MPQPPDKKLILIVEDEMDMRFFLKTLLETSGFGVVMASDGAQGIDCTTARRPDLILLDVMMPRQGGLLMYRHLRQDPGLRQIPVIILSAVDRRSFLHSLKMLGAQSAGPLPPPDGYIEKPPDPDRVLHAIRQFL